MNGDLYLKSLQAQLKGFSPEVQAQLIEEIAAHIEAGENDPGLGRDAADRARRLEKELGSPADLGHRLRQVHRPGRWLDFLLVTLPTILVFPLLPLFANWITGPATQALTQIGPGDSLLWVSLRLSILIQTGLVLTSRWKGSPGVMIHWLASVLLAMIGLLLSEIRWPWLSKDPSIASLVGLPEMIFWLAAVSIFLIWLIRVVHAQRSEPLLVILAVIPFLFATANYVSGLTIRYDQIENLDFVFPVIGWFGLSQVAGFIWPALFFLPDQRDLRWAGLMTLPVTYVIYNVWPYRVYPWMVTLYVLPAVLVLVAWIRDARSRLLPTTH